MNPLLSLAIAASAAALVPTTTAATVPPAATAEIQLRALNHRFVHAYGQADAAFVQELVSPDFRMLDHEGRRVDRASLLAALAGHGVWHSVTDDAAQVRLFGSAALLHGVFEALDAKKQPLRMRYTDVYHWTGARWQLVAIQNTLLAADAVTTMLTSNEPAYAPWTGTDPVGDESSILLTLNEQYVEAFRKADVGWYAAHFAPDYVVTRSNGSFADRGSALTAFALPTYATYFRSYPLDKVVVRRFGELALIEAENPFETKTGEKGISRYTDIWHLDSGRWRCVSAHLAPTRAD